MEKKEDRRVTMTKRMLKDALTEMLRETDLYHVSIRELCQRANINRTTSSKLAFGCLYARLRTQTTSHSTTHETKPLFSSDISFSIIELAISDWTGSS